jgi:simple sugar transport system ATP-binding protein
MSVLFGLYEPDEGRISSGETRSGSIPGEASALNIGMVHPHFKLVLNQSVTRTSFWGRSR